METVPIPVERNPSGSPECGKDGRRRPVDLLDGVADVQAGPHRAALVPTAALAVLVGSDHGPMAGRTG